MELATVTEAFTATCAIPGIGNPAAPLRLLLEDGETFVTVTPQLSSAVTASPLTSKETGEFVLLDESGTIVPVTMQPTGSIAPIPPLMPTPFVLTVPVKDPPAVGVYPLQSQNGRVILMLG